MNETIEVAGVGDKAYREMRGDIIFGRLSPGEKLKLEPLRARYDISVTTLREILNRLTSDGFVIAEGQKGFRVAPVSDSDLQELAELRILLENHAMELSFTRGDLDWEAGVVAAYHKLQVLEQKMITGETSVRESWKRADWAFHHALISASGSRQLLRTHGDVFDKYLRYQMLTLTFRGETAAREHRLLMEAALARDFEMARKVLAQHIRGGVEHSLNARQKEQQSVERRSRKLVKSKI